MVVIFGILAILALVAIMGAYIPIYHTYQETCVHRTGNGTLLTRNAYSFAYNYASSDYNDRVAKDLGGYDQTRSADCAQYGQASVQLQTQSDQQQQTYHDDYDLWSGHMALFDQCINHTKSDFPSEPQLRFFVPNITDYVYDVPEWVSRINCSIPEDYGAPLLQNATFDCTLLPACTLPCTGPDQAALQAATFESGCQSEWMVHAGLFRFALALLTYACLNLSRLLIVMGIVRLCWRSLSRHGFEFRGSVDRLGHITKETADMLKDKTDAAIKHFEGVAWIMLTAAILVHIPYIAVLSSYGSTFNASTRETGG